MCLWLRWTLNGENIFLSRPLRGYYKPTALHLKYHSSGTFLFLFLCLSGSKRNKREEKKNFAARKITFSKIAPD